MRKIFIICLVMTAIFHFARSTKAEIQIDQSNLPVWDGAWTAMSWDQSQTFQPGLPILTGVDIDILTANPLLGNDVITVEILKSDVVLATASQPVSVGFEGLLHFDFPTEVAVNVGETYVLSVPGTKDTFGWKYGGDTYPNGVRFLGVNEKPGTDWFFQTYGTTAPATFSGWVFLPPGVPDIGYSLDEGDLLYFYSSEPVWNLNLATGQWNTVGPEGWIYASWPFIYELDSGHLWFALPPVSGLWVYHFSTGQWEVLPRIIP